MTLSPIQMSYLRDLLAERREAVNESYNVRDGMAELAFIKTLSDGMLSALRNAS